MKFEIFIKNLKNKSRIFSRNFMEKYSSIEDYINNIAKEIFKELKNQKINIDILAITIFKNGVISLEINDFYILSCEFKYKSDYIKVLLKDNIFKLKRNDPYYRDNGTLKMVHGRYEDKIFGYLISREFKVIQNYLYMRDRNFNRICDRFKNLEIRI